MRRRYGWLALLFGILALAGCGGSSSDPETPLTLRVIEQGELSGFVTDEAVFRVAHTQAEWSAIWDQHTLLNPPPPIPAVDFSQEMVVALFMGQRNSSGFSIEATEAHIANGQVVVSVQQNETPGTGAIISHPYDFVAIPRSDLPVRFVVKIVRS